jgi:hypothetical protein
LTFKDSGAEHEGEMSEGCGVERTRVLNFELNKNIELAVIRRFGKGGKG